MFHSFQKNHIQMYEQNCLQINHEFLSHTVCWATTRDEVQKETSSKQLQSNSGKASWAQQTWISDTCKHLQFKQLLHPAIPARRCRGCERHICCNKTKCRQTNVIHFVELYSGNISDPISIMVLMSSCKWKDGLYGFVKEIPWSSLKHLSQK